MIEGEGRGAGAPGPAIPRWLAVVYTLWIVGWAIAYQQQYGAANFLWLCNLANFVVLVGLWWQSSLLLSSQAVSVLLIQLLWSVDFLGRLALGFHPLGATLYMFSDTIPLWIRGLSLFHLAMPPLLLWCVWRLGYDRRGWLLQTLIAWVVLPISFFFTDPERNVNWLWKPFERPQELVPPILLLALMMLFYPLVLYLPTHWALLRWDRWLGRRRTPSGEGVRSARR